MNEKRTRHVLVVVVIALLLLVLATQGGCEVGPPSVHAEEDPEYLAFIPLAVKEDDPKGGATATPTPTVVSPTPTPTATPESQWFLFLTGWDDVRMKGLPTDWIRRTSMADLWGDVVYPEGVFIVLLMDVQNCGIKSAFVSRYDTFWMRSGDGPFFDMAPLETQWAAEYEYGRIGVYETLQPQFIYQMVFVFDVPPENVYDLWYRPWTGPHAKQVHGGE